jgi:hypothetical protein
MKIYAIVDGDGYQIKVVEETETAYKITWDFEAGTMTVADEPSEITIPDERYNYEEMYKKLNVNYYIEESQAAGNIETGVTANPKTSAQTIKPSKGYDGLKQVAITAVTSAIDSNIVAGNIKNGVTILGVEGTYDVPTLPNEEWAIYNYVNSSASTELELLQALSVDIATGLYQQCLNYGEEPMPNIVKGTNLLATFNITLAGDNTMEFVSSTGTYEGVLGYDSETGEDTFVVTEVTE